MPRLPTATQTDIVVAVASRLYKASYSIEICTARRGASGNTAE